MTQGRPRLSKQKDFNVFWCCSRRRPDTDLPSPLDLKVRNASYLDKGTFSRVLNYESALTVRQGGMLICDLNHDIEIPYVAHQCWHASERDFGMRAPATKHVRVHRSRAEVWALRQASSRRGA